jgi:hypothetical protein
MVCRLDDVRKINDPRVKAFRAAEYRIMLISPEAKERANLANSGD